MRSIKLFRLAVLFLIVAALSAGAFAGLNHMHFRGGPFVVELTGLAGASGEATLRSVTWNGYALFSTGHLHVTCEGLSPKATYVVTVTDLFTGTNWTLNTNQNGAGNAGGVVDVPVWYDDEDKLCGCYFSVDVYDDAALVLSGEGVFNW